MVRRQNLFFSTTHWITSWNETRSLLINTSISSCDFLWVGLDGGWRVLKHVGGTLRHSDGGSAGRSLFPFLRAVASKICRLMFDAYHAVLIEFQNFEWNILNPEMHIAKQAKNFDVPFFNIVLPLCRYIIASTAWEVAFPCHFHLIEIRKIVLNKKNWKTVVAVQLL